MTASWHQRSYALAGSFLLICMTAARERPLTPQERVRIYSWLQCEECVDGELAAVRRLGRSSTTGRATVDSLSEDLLGGPSAERRGNLQRQFLSSYRRVSAYADTIGFGLGVTSVEYVEHYRDNFVNLYRVRAAIALAEIGGPKATAVLDSAAHNALRTRGDTLRADTQQAILFARDSILGP
jgi:hypothetical protein